MAPRAVLAGLGLGWAAVAQGCGCPPPVGTSRRENATNIQRANVGEDSSNINQAWGLALNYYENPTDQTNHEKAFAVINRNGANEAAKYILDARGNF